VWSLLAVQELLKTSNLLFFLLSSQGPDILELSSRRVGGDGSPRGGTQREGGGDTGGDERVSEVVLLGELGGDTVL